MRRRALFALARLVPVALLACSGGSSAEHGAIADGGATTDATILGVGDDAALGDDGAATDSDASSPGEGNGNGGDGAVSGGDDDGGATDAFGSTLVRGGTHFRVWAPDATLVQLSITGTGTPDVTTTMVDEGDGTYAITVPGAGVGARYAYVLTTPGGTFTRVDPYCRQLSSDSSGCLVTDPSAYRWSSDGFVAPTRAASVVYELHVGSFSAAGTFAGATAKIADLASLGVNVIELMPVNPSAGGVGSWGYGPDLYMAPNLNYGTEDDLRSFVDTAHQAGIAVWQDVVMNHSDGASSAPLVCFDLPCPKSTGGLYYFPAGTYAETPYGPRPDYTKPNVVDMLLTATTRSLDDDRFDGFRWDSVSNIRAVDGSGTVPGGRDLLVAANAAAHARGALSVAEDLKGDNDITSSDPATGFSFDAQWDGFGYNVTPVLTTSSDANRNIATVVSELQGGDAGDPFARLMFLEDHDTVGNGGSRLPDQIDPANPTSLFARKRSILGAAILMTTPGVPMIFMGEESLTTGTFTDPAATLAAPTTLGLQGRTFFHDMIALRKTLPGLQSTSVTIVQQNTAAHVLAYSRGTTLVVVNLANKAYTEYDVGVPTAGAWNVALNSDSTTYGSDFGGGKTGAITAKSGAKDGQPYSLPLVLGAYSAVIVTPP